MRLRGYTFIEIIIALAVVIIITGVGVARYNNYIQQQNFVSSGEKLVACIQQGQQYAVSGAKLSNNTPARYVMVTVEPDPSVSGLRCTSEGVDATVTDPTILFPENTGNGIGIGDSVFQVTEAPNITLSQTSGSMFRIIFGALERGLPIEYTNNGTTSSKPANAVAGLGFASSFGVVGDSTMSATVTVAQNGSPVSLVNVVTP